MCNITKPMLAGTCEQMKNLKFPVLATPKLDGIRCLKIGGKAVSRKFLPISNDHIRTTIEDHLPDGVDGELVVQGVPFSETAGHVGRQSGTPAFTYMVFDYVPADAKVPYEQRVEKLRALAQEAAAAGHTFFKPILPVKINTLAELEAYEAQMVAEGYEGVMVRSPESPYKCGRSTEREGFLLKIKRWADDEAEVIGTYEGMTNQNEAEKDALGRTKRSMSQAGMVGRGELGGFHLRIVTGDKKGVEFDLGYNHVNGGVDRLTLWQQREKLIGKFVKFSHQPSGAKDKPRFPKFVAFRETWDMSE